MKYTITEEDGHYVARVVIGGYNAVIGRARTEEAAATFIKLWFQQNNRRS